MKSNLRTLRSGIGNDIIVAIRSSKHIMKFLLLKSYHQKQSKPSKRQLECYYGYVINTMIIEDISKLMYIKQGTAIK